MSVTFTIAGSGANPANSADFVSNTLTGTVSFNQGDPLNKPVTVQIQGDTAFEPDEGYIVTLSNPVNATIAVPAGSGTILNDDQQLPDVWITVPDATADERGTLAARQGKYRIHRSFSTASDLTVYFNVTGNAEPGDYSLSSGTSSVNIPANTFDVDIVLTANADDDLSNEAVTINLAAHSSYNFNGSTTGTVNIIDKPKPTASFSGSSTVTEDTGSGLTNMNFTLSLPYPPGGNGGTVTYQVNPTGPFPVDASDFDLAASGLNSSLQGTATFQATEQNKTITLKVKQDAEIEENETFTLAVIGATGEILAGSGVANGTIDNDDVDDPPTTPTDVDGNPNAVFEGAPQGTLVGINADSSDPEGLPIIFTLEVDENGRFQIDSSGVVTVGPNWTAINRESASSHTITVRASDGVNHSDQQFTITVLDVAPLSPWDDDGAPGGSVPENAAGGTPVGITAKSTDVNGGTVTYSFASNPGGLFAINPNSGVITVAAGAVLDFETAQSHQVSVLAHCGSGTSTATQFTINVTNVIEDATVSITATDDTAYERKVPTDSTATFVISRTGGELGSITVGLSTSGSATYGSPSGNDYTLSATSVTLSFGGPAATVVLTAIADTVAENGDETATISIDQGAGYIAAPGASSDDATIKDSPHVKVKATKPRAFETSMPPFFNFNLGAVNGEYQISVSDPSSVLGSINVPFTLSGEATPPPATDRDYDLTGTFNSQPGGGEVTLGSNASVTLTLVPVNDGFDPQNEEGPEHATLTLTPDDAQYVLEEPEDTVTIYEVGILVVKLDDLSIDYEVPLGQHCDCDCGCIGGTPGPEETLPNKNGLHHDGSAIDTTVTVGVGSTVQETDPPSAPPAGGGGGGNQAALMAGGGSTIPSSMTGIPRRLMQVTMVGYTFQQEVVWPEFQNPPVPLGGGTSGIGFRDLFFDVTNNAVGDFVMMGIDLDLSQLPTNVYQLDVSVKTVYDDGNGTVTESPPVTTTVDLGVINHNLVDPFFKRPDAGLPPGWSISGIQQIRELRSGNDVVGVWYTPGDGEIYFFRKDGASFVSPRGKFWTLTKVGNDYVITDKYGTDYTFYWNDTNGTDLHTLAGLLRVEEDRNFQTLNYAYHGTHVRQLASITNRFGRSVNFTYNALGQLTAISDFDGITYTFEYDPVTGELSAVNTPDPDAAGSGRLPIQTRFGYTTDGDLHTVTETDDRHLPVQDQRILLDTEFLRTSDPSGTFLQEIHKDPAYGGSNPTWQFRPGAGVPGMVDTSDPNVATDTNPAAPLGVSPLIGSMTDPSGHTDQYEIDWMGDVIRRGPAGLPNEQSHLIYGPDGMIRSVKLPPVAGETFPLLQTYEYDTRGNVTEYHEIPNNDESQERVWTWTYDATYSQATSYTDEFGRLTTYQLDAYGNTTRIIEPDRDLSDTIPAPETVITYYLPANIRSGFIESITEPDPDGPNGQLLAPVTLFVYATADGQLERVKRRTPSSGTGWVDQEKYVYNADRNLIQVWDELSFQGGGYLISPSSYNGLKQPGVVVEAPGNAAERRTIYVYDGFGRVIQIQQQDPDGTGPLPVPVYDFSYDRYGSLLMMVGPEISVVMPDGSTVTTRPTTSYQYNFAGRLTQMTDPNGGVTTFEYDDHGNLEHETWPDPDGAGSAYFSTVIDYTWDERHRLESRQIEDPLNPGVFLANESYVYDAFGRIENITDELSGAVTNYEYVRDANDMPTPHLEITEAFGTAAARTTRYEHDNLDNLVRVIQPDPVSGEPAGPEWQYSFDNLSRLTAIHDPLYATNPARETTFAYDVLSRLTQVTYADPDGTATTLEAPYVKYIYSANHNVVEERIQAAATGGGERVTTHGYDRLSRRTSTTLPAPGFGQPNLGVLGWQFDKLGRLQSSTDQRGQTTNYGWNSASWLTSVTLPDPDGSGTGLPRPVMNYGHDANGWLRTEESPGPDGTLLPTEYNRDALGRVRSVVGLHPGSDNANDEATTQYGYDALGRTVSIIDPLSNETTYDYDPVARTVTTTQPDPDDAGPLGPLVTEQTFDLVGNLVELTDPNGSTTTFQHDLLNRLIQENDPYGKQIIYEYDLVGNVTVRKDRYLRPQTGQRAQRKYTYDNLNRLTREDWKSNAASTPIFHQIRYTWDNGGRLARVGELRGNSNPNAPANDEYVYSYDNLDRLLTVVDTANFAANPVVPNTVPNIPVELAHTYNAEGDVASTQARITYAGALRDDFTNLFDYDNLGRTTQIVQQGTAYTGQPAIARKRVDIAYNQAGQFDAIVRSVGSAGSEMEVATSDFSYFDNGGLETIVNSHSGASLAGMPGFPTLPSGTDISTYAWTYDVAGRVDTFHVTAGTLDYSYDYDYDHIHQLIGSDVTIASGSPGALADEDFQYDANGNDTTDGRTYDHDRLISSGSGTTTYGFDSEGNLVATIVTGTSQEIMKWDVRNRLTSVEFKNADGTVTNKLVLFTYDAFNRLVAKQVDENPVDADGWERQERYVWDGLEMVLVLDGADGDVLHRFLHGPAIDQVFADESAVNGLLWYLGDNQNTTRDVIDNNGDVFNHLIYSVFGEIKFEKNSDNGDPATGPTPFFAYTGRMLDEDTGLQNNWNRWYDPKQRRWLGEDPDRYAAGDTNLYRYVGNSPTNFIDPEGQQKKVPSNGETSATKAGKEAHKYFPSAIGVDPGQTLPGGKRTDGIKESGRRITIPELKPESRLMPEGELGGAKLKEAIKQLQDYADKVPNPKGKPVYMQLWGWVYNKTSKCYEYTKLAEWKKGRAIPVIGSLLAILGFAQTAEAKGVDGAIAESAIGMIPGSTAGQALLEAATGEPIVPNVTDDPRDSAFLPPSIRRGLREMQVREQLPPAGIPTAIPWKHPPYFAPPSDPRQCLPANGEGAARPVNPIRH